MDPLAVTLVFYLCLPPDPGRAVLACEERMTSAGDCARALAQVEAGAAGSRLILPAGCLPASSAPPPMAGGGRANSSRR